MDDYYVKDFNDLEMDTIWDLFLDYGVCGDEALSLITSINGYNPDTMADVLYAAWGLRSLEQFVEECQITPEDRPDLFDTDEDEEEYEEE